MTKIEKSSSKGLLLSRLSYRLKTIGFRVECERESCGYNKTKKRRNQIVIKHFNGKLLIIKGRLIGRWSSLAHCYTDHHNLQHNSQAGDEKGWRDKKLPDGSKVYGLQPPSSSHKWSLSSPLECDMMANWCECNGCEKRGRKKGSFIHFIIHHFIAPAPNPRLSLLKRKKMFMLLTAFQSRN